MRSKMLNAVLKTAAMAGFLLAAAAASAQTHVYWQAESFSKSIPDGAGGSINVSMWGFAECDNTWTCDAPTSPGPQINATVGETVIIHVQNTLPNMPVSIIIPGQGGAGDPVPMTSDPARVGSMTHEAAPGGAEQTYEFAASEPGTYLYHSGSYPSLEVPMGLYGAMVVSPAASAACATGVSAYDDLPSCYDADRVLLFSEVDPYFNDRMNAASMSFAPATACQPLSDYAASLIVTGIPCTVDYNPLFLLANGEPSVDFSDGNAVDPGDAVLLRLLNAGLRSHVPAFVGIEFDVLAENGNRYPGQVRQQSAVLVAAGATIDALIDAPEADTDLRVFDRMPSFENLAAPGGSVLGSFQVGAGATDPVANPVANADEYWFDKDNPLVGKNVLANDVDMTGATVSLNGAPPAGNLVLNGDGSFTYQAPGPVYSGDVSFAYDALLNGMTYSAGVTIHVNFADETPVARDDAYTNTTTPGISVSAADGVLANDSDPDGSSLTASIEPGDTLPSGTVSCGGASGMICADGSFDYEPGVPGVVDTFFTYTASDGTNTDTGRVDLHIIPVANMTLIVQEPDGTSVDAFHWVLEEDTTWKFDKDNPQLDTLGTNFHKSYMPVIAQGDNAASFGDVALDPTKYYFVSVLPLDGAEATGHALGGAQIEPGQTSVTVNVNTMPTPYAQISLIVFNDSAPTNGALDGGEEPLGMFRISLEDAGGRYGASAGEQSQDANGDPLTNALDCFGDVVPPPPGVILTCPNTPANEALGYVGRAVIKNLAPAKYGVSATPPGSETALWSQTSTIEGTRIIDAWVKANEPPFFQEFGPPGYHVFIGFVNADEVNARNEGGTNTISGKVTNLHMSRPPYQTLYDSGSYDALAHTRAWVGVNTLAGDGPNIAIVQADENGDFTISGLPDGTHQLVIWDKYLDQIIAYRNISMPADNGANFNIPVFQWFTRLENWVFNDLNGDGVRDEGENEVIEQNINLRWRDGTIYQAFPTDGDGFVPFDQEFPFFHWLVAEVDYARFEPTGATITVDGGGDSASYDGILNPQDQGGGDTSYTLTGPILTLGQQGFLGQTSVIEWGKRRWAPGSNGGISGIVYYAVTRAENDPRLAAAEPWEPGIPGIPVRLYREVTRFDGSTELVLVDETVTDSWDASLPTGCPGAYDGSDTTNLPGVPADNAITGGSLDKCYDGIRNFNQIREAVFDGGYAFNDIPAGTYIVEVVPPAGYTLLKEEDVNVGFGETFDVAPVSLALPGGALLAATLPDLATIDAAMSAEPGLAQPPCVGETRTVPDYLSLFPGAMEIAPFFNTDRPLCDRKQVTLVDQGQSAADFFLFSDTPVAAHYTGVVLDDTAVEFNPASINWGEKYAPPFLPVSFRDYKGREITRGLTDQWGRFNGLVPSTYTANMPAPSGMSPNMLQSCKNHPGPIPDPDNPGSLITDPNFDPSYGTFCFTFQYMPGSTTYLDTPVAPVSAFASGDNTVDCEPATGTPKIRQVDGIGDGPLAASGGTLTIRSFGTTTVPNPAYDGLLGVGGDKTVDREFGFGTHDPDAGTGTVSLTDTDTQVSTVLDIVSWSDGMIVANIPADFGGTYQLEVTTDAGVSTTEGITVEVDFLEIDPTRSVIRVPENAPTIQAGIDAAGADDLVLVSPGSYNEQLIMSKPVRLQGSGHGATFLSGIKSPSEALIAWRERMDCLYGIGAGCTKVVDQLPNAIDGAAGFDTEEGGAITVVAVADRSPGPPPANSFRRSGLARIDGMSISGGEIGGGVFVNGYADRLQISNNRIRGNSGSYHGGIRVGRPFLVLEENGPYGFNNDVNIHHNAVTQNGSFDGAGAGISIAAGSDGYRIDSNYVCGNFTQGDGAGIGHLGRSDGIITGNTIVFNQSFNQGLQRSGGGLFIGGELIAPVVQGTPPVVPILTKGAGNVTVSGNLIQGNHAASGFGGGVRLEFINGQDILDSIGNNGRTDPDNWFQVSFVDNDIVNNVAGFAGAGVSVQDAANITMQSNRIARNDSTATVAGAFTTGNVNVSAKQISGLALTQHSAELVAAIPDQTQNDVQLYRYFSNPVFSGANVIWENRSFNYDAADGSADLDPYLDQGTVGECPNGAVFDDWGVLGDDGTLEASVDLGMTVLTGGNANFVAPYCNGGRALIGAPGPMRVFPALDEAGATWIDVRWGPIQKMGDYSRN